MAARRAALLHAGLSSLLLLLLISMLWLYGAAHLEKRREAAVKKGVIAIQWALENWAQSHQGSYPESIFLLHVSLPINPYSGKPMPQINPGDEHIPGGFSYLPLLAGPDTADIAGYELIGYGRREMEGNRILLASNLDPLSLPLKYSVIHFGSGIKVKEPQEALLP